MKKYKFRGRYKLTYDLGLLLTRKRIIFDSDVGKLMTDILDKKYQDTKRYDLDEKV